MSKHPATPPTAPNHTAAQALFQQAAKYHQSGMLMQAEAAYHEALRADPRHADTLHMLGMLANQLGRNEEAIAWLMQAIKAKKNAAFFHHNLGSVYQDVGDLDAAASCYKHALRLKPDLTASHNNLGNILYQQGKIKDALPYFERALRLAPDNPEWRFNYGVALRKAGKIDDAVGQFQKALQLRSDYADVRLQLATCYRDLEKEQEAVDNYEAVLRHRPDYVALCNLARLYRDRADVDSAKSCYERALALQPDDGCKFKLALLFPIVPASSDALRQAREEYADRLEWLAQQDLHLNDPSIEVGETSFLLAYQGDNDAYLQTKLAKLYERACPNLLYTAAHCRTGEKRADGKIRIGFVSRYLREHSVGGSMLGIIANLARDQFDVRVFFMEEPKDDTARAIRAAADHAAVLPKDLAQARERIAADGLDILFYPEIGMDPFTYFLAFARLARVQCVTWGHLDTTGIANIDYYVSNADAEPEDSDAHYSEKLVRLKNSAMFPCYTRPAESGSTKTRADYGLDETAHLYICPQSLFKLHPEFDAILARILREDASGKLVLPEGRPHWRQLLMQRLSTALPDIASRIVWMPWQDRVAYRDWIRLSDVMLDPIHYGGGVSSLDGFPTGTPIVTLPGAFMRGRFTYACYRRMEVFDCVAKDVDDYATKALRLAEDSAYRTAIRQKILDRHAVLFDDMEGLRQLEAFLMHAVRHSRTDNVI